LTYNIQVSETALIDVLETLAWYDEISEKLSRRFEIDLNSKLKFLSKYPENFQVRYLRKMRVAPLAIFPYGIHFYITGNAIVVVGVFHYSLSPKRWKNRK